MTDFKFCFVLFCFLSLRNRLRPLVKIILMGLTKMMLMQVSAIKKNINLVKPVFIFPLKITDFFVPDNIHRFIFPQTITCRLISPQRNHRFNFSLDVIDTSVYK